jgi:hypothetical protein
MFSSISKEAKMVPQQATLLLCVHSIHSPLVYQKPIPASTPVLPVQASKLQCNADKDCAGPVQAAARTWDHS